MMVKGEIALGSGGLSVVVVVVVIVIVIASLCLVGGVCFNMLLVAAAAATVWRSSVRSAHRSWRFPCRGRS